jgi:TolB protein
MNKDIRKLLTVISLMLITFCMSINVQAEVDLVIDKSGEDSAIRLLIAPFQHDAFAHQMRQILMSDLKRSGRFKFVNVAGNILPFGGSLNPEQLKKSGAEFLIRGKSIPKGSSSDLEVEIIDINNGRKVAGYVTPTQQNKRSIAHKTADAIYKQLTSVRGAFDTKIAYVAANGVGSDRVYQLIVADADGYNHQAVVTSFEPIMSIAWAPTGRKIAYVSFESGRPVILIQNLRTGKRRTISARKGINGAPAWSKNGKKLAVSLSVEGNSEIYTIDIASGKLTRITHSRAIDTEPSWARNDSTIIFTSNRGGSPQLYQVSSAGKNSRPKRITFNGKYNSAADVVGNKLALIRRSGGKFRVVLMDLVSHESDTISRGSLDESPSLAPNGAMVLYETRGKGRKHILSVASDNGRANTPLYSPYIDVGHPAWSPFIR